MEQPKTLTKKRIDIIFRTSDPDGILTPCNRIKQLFGLPINEPMGCPTEVECRSPGCLKHINKRIKEERNAATKN